MSEPSLAAQKAMRSALLGASEVTALVPSGSILDRNARPELSPSIILGEAQTVDDSADCIDAWEVYADLHIWTREAGLTSAKAIAGAVQRALRRLDVEVDGYALSIISQDARFLRDPDGEHAHAVVSATLLAEEF